MGTTTIEQGAKPQHANPKVAAVLAFAASGKAGATLRTPNEWVQDGARAGMLPAACVNVGPGSMGKKYALALRGYVGRSTGNGVGRGSTYPPISATELLALGGYALRAATATTDKAAQTAHDKAHTTWDRAHKRRARGTVAAAGSAPVQQDPAAAEAADARATARAAEQADTTAHNNAVLAAYATAKADKQDA